MTFRFLHASDLHVGKPFGRFDSDLRGALRAERQAVIGRLAEAARAGGAGHVLLAGDAFDVETPAPATLRHTLQILAEARDLTWVLLPGNHDSLAATELWSRLAAARPANVVLATDAAPLALADGVALLPAPCPARRSATDPTARFGDIATPEGSLRIGLAHGGVAGFDSSEDDNAAIIAPDRAERAGLDYLALGDWHRQMRVGPRTWYSGTPESDGFKHDTAAGALLVTASAGAVPQVVPVVTGRYHWADRGLDLLEGDDPAAVLAALLGGFARRRTTLLQLAVRGRARPLARVTLDRAFADAAPDFAFAELQADALAVVQDAADLDAIDRGGALRAAAEALLAEASDDRRPPEDRRTAAAALARLFALSGDVA